MKKACSFFKSIGHDKEVKYQRMKETDNPPPDSRPSADPYEARSLHNPFTLYDPYRAPSHNNSTQDKYKSSDNSSKSSAWSKYEKTLNGKHNSSSNPYQSDRNKSSPNPFATSESYAKFKAHSSNACLLGGHDKYTSSTNKYKK